MQDESQGEGTEQGVYFTPSAQALALLAPGISALGGPALSGGPCLLVRSARVIVACAPESIFRCVIGQLVLRSEPLEAVWYSQPYVPKCSSGSMTRLIVRVNRREYKVGLLPLKDEFRHKHKV